MRRKILAMFIVTLLNIALIAGAFYLSTSTLCSKYDSIQGAIVYTIMFIAMANYLLGYAFADITDGMSRSKQVAK